MIILKEMKKFDLIVIGTGSAGAATAHRCRKAGWKVAIVDWRPFGGTCALRGCDPKKVLVGVTEGVDWARRMNSQGIVSKDLRIDWPALIKFKKTFTDPHPKQVEDGFLKAGIVTFHDKASFLDKTSMKIGELVLQAKHIVIAIGTEPMKLGISGEKFLTTSEQFLELRTLPKEIIFVGGGYISSEFAHIAARAGAKVQILHRADRLLKGFDPDLVNQLVKATEELGIDVLLNTVVEGIAKKGSKLVVTALVREKKQTFSADMVVHGAGRVPEIDQLDLGKANVKSEKRGIVVNEYLQSVSNKAVYAAGDAAITEGLPLTPIAALEGIVVAHNLLKGNTKKPDYTGTASAVFTIPTLASVGLLETDAKKQGLKFKTNFQDTSNWYSSRRVSIKHSASKVLVEEGTDRILGAHILGAHADELINLFVVAIKSGISAGELKKMLYAYPSGGSDVPYMV